MARVAPESPRNTEESFETQAKEYSFLKKQTDYLEKQLKELREKLFSHLDESGELDSNGNVVVELSTVEGYSSMMKQRRVTRKIDEEVAFALIEEKGLKEKLIVTKEIVDEDALMAALYNDELTEEEIDRMYPQNVVWALVLKK